MVLRFLVHRLILVRYKFSAVILMFQDLGHFRHENPVPMRLYVALLAFLMFSSTVVRAELVSDLVIPIWVALSTTGIILLSIFQKPSFVTIVLILDLTGRITLLVGCSWYPSRLLKSTVYHRLHIQWVVSNQCNIICAGRSTDINISNFPT